MDGLIVKDVRQRTGQVMHGVTNATASVATMIVSPAQIGAGREDIMRDPFANYDAWLEAPYQDMIAESDAFYDWAEAEGFDVEDPEDLALAELAYESYIESSYDYDYDDYDDQEDMW